MSREELLKVLPDAGIDAIMRYYEGYEIEFFHVWCIEGSPRSYKIVVRHTFVGRYFLDFLSLDWDKWNWIVTEDASKLS